MVQVGNQERPVHKKCVICGKEVIGAERTVCDDDGGMLALIGNEPQPGDIFAERYEIIGLIGDGGWGKVYKAQHKLMKRSVAIKVLLPHLVKSQQALKRFQQEARAASSLNHPNVMTVFDFGTTEDGLPFLVMDLLEGTSLSAVLQQEQYLPVNRALKIFMQVCEGLAHAHEKGVIHRDVKPNNLMLVRYIGQTDFVKIVDFGIAKIATPGEGEGAELTQTGEIFGSPMYMSPEQCRGKELDARSDIYSTGCVLYRCLAGKPAFVGRDAMECMFKQVHDEPVPFRESCPEHNIPAALEVVVFKALAKEPEMRFQHMIEFRDALMELYQNIVGEVPVTASTQLRLYAVAPGTADEVEQSDSTDALNRVHTTEQPVPAAVHAEEISTGSGGSSTPGNSNPADIKTTADNPADNKAAVVNTPTAHSPATKDEVKPPAPAAQVKPEAVPDSTAQPERDEPKTAGPKESSHASAQPVPPAGKASMRSGVILTAVALVFGAVVGFSMLKGEDNTKSPPTTPDSVPVSVPVSVVPNTPSGVDSTIRVAKESIEQADYQKAIARLQDAEKEVSQMSDQKKAGTYLLEILPLLGQCYLDTDNPEAARAAFDRVAPKQKKELGDNSTEYARTETGLGIALTRLGDAKGAERLLNHALSVIQQQPASEQKGLCDVYYGLARVAEAKHDVAKANELLNQALKHKQSEGEPDIESANLMVNIAQIYMLRKQYPKAQELLEKALVIEKGELGEDSTTVAGSMKNLAVVYYQTGQSAKAEELFKKALEINNRLNSSDSLLGAEIMSAMAILYANEGRLKDALPLASHSLDIRRKMLGADSPVVKRDQLVVAQLTAALKRKK